jgi:ABC-2 type transport system ATP-binding protein
MERILEVENITKDFLPPLSLGRLLKSNFRKRRPTRALENVTFSLGKGSILGILGPNGAGKTTLLKIISTLILPDKGSVSLNGIRIDQDEQRTKSLVGMVLAPERSFYYRLTGMQNLDFFARLYGLNAGQAKARIDELLGLFNVDYQHRRFYSYSTGMQQKFSLMRALLNEPELLLLDEPTKSLDYSAANTLRAFIREELCLKRVKTVIFTTHHMDEAEEFADTFLILHKGRVFGCGTIEELRKAVGDPTASIGKIFLKLTQS